MADVPRIAVVGRDGQVARALRRRATERGIGLIAAGRPHLDIRDAQSVNAFVRSGMADVIVNAAAYTAVDNAETDAAAAFQINAIGPHNLARACRAYQLPLVHISTDYVFDGETDRPYREDDWVAPLGVYGASKAEGERRVRETLDRHLIVRTQWVFSLEGANFVRTMLRLGAEREEVRVVADQFGSPTWAVALADVLIDMCIATADLAPVSDKWGTYHAAGGGQASWHDLAADVFRLSAKRGYKVPRLIAIGSQDYPTPARRPRFSVLDTTRLRTAFGLALPPWQQSLEACLCELPDREIPGTALPVEGN